MSFLILTPYGLKLFWHYFMQEETLALVQMLTVNNITVSNTFVKDGTNVSERSDLLVS